MYEKLEACPSCKNTQFNNFKICKDHTVTQESFALVKCSKCQLVFTNPRPTFETIGRYYQSENYISHTNKGNNLVNRLYKLVQLKTFRDKERIIKSYSTRKEVYDFGCGAGRFLSYLNNKGWSVEGYEPSSAVETNTAMQTGITIAKSLEDVKKGEKFQIITAWHVIEHVHELKSTLKMLRKKLTSDGYLFIAVPNINSNDAMYYNENWAAFDVPRHLYHFNKETMTRLIKGNKMNLIEVIPMKYDAYYVSILSEKICASKHPLINGIKRGFKSNQAAAKTMEYSSLIYVLSK